VISSLKLNKVQQLEQNSESSPIID